MQFAALHSSLELRFYSTEEKSSNGICCKLRVQHAELSSETINKTEENVEYGSHHITFHPIQC